MFVTNFGVSRLVSRTLVEFGKCVINVIDGVVGVAKVVLGVRADDSSFSTSLYGVFTFSCSGAGTLGKTVHKLKNCGCKAVQLILVLLFVVARVYIYVPCNLFFLYQIHRLIFCPDNIYIFHKN